MLDIVDQRSILEPHVGKRVFVEGVLIDITTPNKKNHFTYGLVFASVNLPNEKLELDHVVIPVKKDFTQLHELKIYTKYGFSALVDTYEKTKNIEGVLVQAKAYQLNNINKNRFNESVPLHGKPLSIYIQNRLRRLSIMKLPIDIDQLGTVLQKKAQGEREQYIGQLTTTLQKTNVTQANILDTLYLKRR